LALKHCANLQILRKPQRPRPNELVIPSRGRLRGLLQKKKKKKNGGFGAFWTALICSSNTEVISMFAHFFDGKVTDTLHAGAPPYVLFAPARAGDRRRSASDSRPFAFALLLTVRGFFSLHAPRPAIKRFPQGITTQFSS